MPLIQKTEAQFDDFWEKAEEYGKIAGVRGRVQNVSLQNLRKRVQNDRYLLWVMLSACDRLMKGGAWSRDVGVEPTWGMFCGHYNAFSEAAFFEAFGYEPEPSEASWLEVEKHGVTLGQASLFRHLYRHFAYTYAWRAAPSRDEYNNYSWKWLPPFSYVVGSWLGMQRRPYPWRFFKTHYFYEVVNGRHAPWAFARVSFLERTEYRLKREFFDSIAVDQDKTGFDKNWVGWWYLGA